MARKTLYDLKVEDYEKWVNAGYAEKESKEIAKEERRRHLIKLFRKSKRSLKWKRKQ